MTDVREIYEMVTQQTPPKPDALERQRKRQMRQAMNRRIGGFAAAAAIAGLALLAVRAWVGDGGHQPGGPPVTVSGVPKVDYVIDLNTGVMTPLPEAVIRSTGKSGRLRCIAQFQPSCSPQYAASPDGSLLAYVGTGTEGGRQIFIAGTDGTRVHQVTHDPTGASSPAWSPDGTRIAYLGSGSGNVRNLFVLDVATSDSTLITDGTRDVMEGIQVTAGEGIQFTPDGSSILYTSGPDEYTVVWSVPVTGGKNTLFIGPGQGVTDAGNGSLSPDGSLVTFTGSGEPRSSKPSFHCGPCRFLANADGTNRRVIPGGGSNPAGTWSPDGSRIVCRGDEGGIIVVDVATGHSSQVAEGNSAIWVDDHTLLVER
jgi:Tol biopolymer transport system component